MYRKDGKDFVRITDPLDRVVGTPGAPGARTDPPTHTTGSRYIMSWDDFTSEFEAAGNIDRIQLLHCGGTFGHTANTGGSTPPGYALAAEGNPNQSANSDGEVTLLPAPPPQARAMDAIAAVSAIGGVLPLVFSDSSGDVSWDLDQFRGIKHPNDHAPPTPRRVFRC
jgi:hypothetical protein